MSSTDFFDDDLVKPRTESPVNSNMALAEGPNTQDPAHSFIREDRVVSDLDLARMSKHRDSLEGQAAKTLTEIERLKLRTDDLETEKRQLESLRKKQDLYVSSKREMMQRLNQSLLAIEKEEVKATQLVELYSSTRERFRKMFADIEKINESDWPEETMKDELSKSQDLVDSIRVECSKALVKLDTFASTGEVGSFVGVGADGHGSSAAVAKNHGFAYWMKVGLAISIPMALLIGVVGVVAFFAVTRWIP